MRARRIALLFAYGAYGACVAFTSREASAYERQQHFGLATGGVLSQTDGGSTRPGIDLGLHYTYGVTDAFNFVAEAGSAQLTTDAPLKKNTPAEPGTLAHAGVGATYVFDVVRWVPYAGALIGPSYFAGGHVPKAFFTPDAQIAVGLDYEISRSWAVGAAYRQHLFFTKMSAYPELTSLQLRLEYVWGW